MQTTRGAQSPYTGRPTYQIPSPQTVSRDVKHVFVKVRQRIAKMLRVNWTYHAFMPQTNAPNCKEHDGAINFATDAWTSPNSRAYVAVTAHFEHKGVAISMLLDIVEVVRSHSGLNLAAAFANILDDFGISDKVGCHRG